MSDALGLLSSTLDNLSIDLACYDKSCAPPPVGKGGSSKGGGKRWTGLSPRPEDRKRIPRAAISSIPADPEDLSDLGFSSDEELLRSMYDHDLGGGYSSSITSIRISQGIDVLNGNRKVSTAVIKGSIEVERDGLVYDPGSFERVVQVGVDPKTNRNVLTVEHDTLKLEPDHQGRGVADRFNSASVEQYQRLGVDHISLHAALSVGPYAWARQGFRIADESMRREWVQDRTLAVRKVLSDGVEQGRWSAEDARELTSTVVALGNASKKGEDVQPIHVASLGENDARFRWEALPTDVGGEPRSSWPGKEVLVDRYTGRDTYGANAAWFGRYYLDAANPVTSAATRLDHVAHRHAFGASESLVAAIHRRYGFSQMLEENREELACYDASCAPPPVGTGGSKKGGRSAATARVGPGGDRPGMGDRDIPAFGTEDSAWSHIDPATSKFTEERQKLHDEIIEKLVGGYERQENPTYLMMGGGGGAGKTTVLKAGLIDIPENGPTLNADDIKEMLPEASQMKAAGDPSWAAFTHEESSYLVDRARRASFERGINVTMDAVGSNAERVIEQSRLARQMGYSVRSAYVTIPVEEGVARARKRFEDAVARGETGRRIPEQVVLQAHIGANRAYRSIWPEMDSSVLIDNTRTPTLISESRSGNMVVRDDALWNEFMQRGGG